MVLEQKKASDYPADGKRLYSLTRTIDTRLNGSVLQKLTRTVIELHRTGSTEKLHSLAVRAGLVPESEALSQRSLFYRIVRTVHPDQLPGLRKRFEAACETSNIPELEKIHSLLTVLTSIHTPIARAFDPGIYREEHVWNDREWGYAEDAEEDSRWEEADGLSFLDAVKLDSVGNLDIEISSFELSQFDGTLDVSRYGLFDLDGAELCVNLVILDASWNNLTGVTELNGADRLTELYLAGNNIYDIGPLSGLSSLELLDLEGNEVEDISTLLLMPALRLVNLRGNPIEDRTILEALDAAGVIVIV